MKSCSSGTVLVALETQCRVHAIQTQARDEILYAKSLTSEWLELEFLTVTFTNCEIIALKGQCSHIGLCVIKSA